MNKVMHQKSKIKLTWATSNKEEQQKIATFLSAIDQKIELIDTEIKQARAFKRAWLAPADVHLAFRQRTA